MEQKTKTINKTACFCSFSTALGSAAIAWRNNKIIGFLLPELSETDLRARIAHNFANYHNTAATPSVNLLIEQIKEYFAGRLANFKAARLDFSNSTPFCQLVYKELCRVPSGSTISYKSLAEACGRPSAARAIGLAAGKNPIPLLVPCHRVVNTDGRLGGFSAGGGTSLKAQMLRFEDIDIEEKPVFRIKPPLLISECDLNQILKHLSKVDNDLGILIKAAPRFNIEFNSHTSIFQALLEFLHAPGVVIGHRGQNVHVLDLNSLLLQRFQLRNQLE